MELLLKWFPFVNLENERSLYYEARKELLKNEYDWVITSGEPFVLFKYALLLKKEFGVKISLDYRDGFSTNMFRNMSPNFLESLTIKLDRVFERKVIISSDLVTFVSHKLKSEIENGVVHLNNINTLIVNNGIDFFTFDENFNGPIPEGGIRLNEEQLARINELGKSDYSSSYPGAIFIEVSWIGEGGGMTVPPFIYLGYTDNLPSKYVKDLKRHEYGHILQFAALGFSMTRYLWYIGTPSICSAGIRPENHNTFITEVAANKLSYEFFGRPKDWNHESFPTGW